MDKIKCAVIGYGSAFNMGKAHADYINSTDGMEVVAVCDTDKSRTEAAKRDFPSIQTYNSLEEMLKSCDFDLAVIVTPHNTHYPLAMQCLAAGKHTIVEKPFCITAREATDMIELAREKGVMLSVFHNRRWDGDYLALKEAIGKGLIGDVYHLEVFMGGYGHPGYWWRSDKEISGGALYDWGAHIVDWILGLIPSKIKRVGGFSHKLVWHDVTNEDNIEAIIQFENGTVAYIQLSSIAMAGKRRWFLLGTKGSLEDEWGRNGFHLKKIVDGMQMETTLPYKKGEWNAYYKNIANHLLKGEELIVKPEEARRVIAVIEMASNSQGEMQDFPEDF
ncbi:Gfo/Idh/MocA family oxidoreductase [bacterium]|nr:Gfo/Idh/MocA family oxidoreductase [bacterium]